ncbi:M48 family metallopeptidase [Erwinia amylovora]|uniref:M48 family metallopeptidase n=1 Tax=Erwinia amylovora TaxID=552 RepID=UPI001443E20F|nr:SprT family zinc-dependent metalloprotease [Erwinia amylovora]
MSCLLRSRPGYFIYGDERISFDRQPRSGATNRVLIKVHPDCRVVVFAPEEADDQSVLDAVKKRGRWIWQQLREFRNQREYITPRQYISGESHYYLGKQYLLKVLAEPGQIQRVKMLRGRLDVTVQQKEPENGRQLLSDWYRSRARDVFRRRLEAMLEQALWVDVPPPLHILTMQTQWGSCSPAGRLTLNPNLVKAHRECIDYVILHELCHLAEHNHSERFYRLMAQVMPQWRTIKVRLDEMANLLIEGDG